MEPYQTTISGREFIVYPRGVPVEEFWTRYRPRYRPSGRLARPTFTRRSLRDGSGYSGSFRYPRVIHTPGRPAE